MDPTHPRGTLESLRGHIGNTMPPRDHPDEDDKDDENDENDQEDDEPPVVREPDENESMLNTEKPPRFPSTALAVAFCIEVRSVERCSNAVSRQRSPMLL